MLKSGPSSGAPPVGSQLQEFGLRQNVPNPFASSTLIRYALAERGHVSIEVFNVAGELVTILVDEVKPAGEHSVSWNGHDVAGNKATSGVYFCRMKSGGFRATRKLLLLR
jgi:hypothetical protein